VHPLVFDSSDVQAKWSRTVWSHSTGNLICKFQTVLTFIAGFGKTSKRVPVRLRHKIEKASVAKQKKAKKQAKKVLAQSNERCDIGSVLTLVSTEPRMAV
jgi:hypothetical protein